MYLSALILWSFIVTCVIMSLKLPLKGFGVKRSEVGTSHLLIGHVAESQSPQLSPVSLQPETDRK